MANETAGKPGSSGKNLIGIGIVAILAVGGGMFFAGMKYGESKTPSPTTGMASGAGYARFRNGARSGQNGGGASGTILSMDSQSITVKMRSGGSKTIYYSGSTKVGKIDSGTASDLKTGDQVVVSGTGNSDGSIAAQNIEIMPAGSGFFLGGGNGAGGPSGGGQAGGQAPNGGGSGIGG